MNPFLNTPGGFANPAGALKAERAQGAQTQTGAINGAVTYVALFGIGRKVEIDKDQTHTGVITQVCFRAATSPEYEVCTWVDGREQRTWLEGFRLCPA